MRNFLASLLLIALLYGCVSPDPNFQLYKKKYQNYKVQKERSPEKAACISQSVEPIPDSIVEQSKKHIISIVGKDYFEENYVLLKDENWGYLHASCNLDFKVRFEYRKLSTFFGEPVQINISHWWPTYESPSVDRIALMKGGKLAEPLITRMMAQELFYRELYQNKDNAEWASKNIPSAPNRLALTPSSFCTTKSEWCWEYMVDQGGGLGCSYSVTHEVDIITGEMVLDHNSDQYCELLVQ